MLCAIWYQIVQFKKREKHSWKSVTFSSKSTGFSRFFDCTDGTKSRKASIGPCYASLSLPLVATYTVHSYFPYEDLTSTLKVPISLKENTLPVCGTNKFSISTNSPFSHRITHHFQISS